MRWACHVARMEEGRRTFKILTCKPTGKRPLGRPTRIRWEENIIMHLKEIGIDTGNRWRKVRIDTFKYHVSCTDGKISDRINFLSPFSPSPIQYLCVSFL